MNDTTQKLIVVMVVIPILVGLFRSKWEMSLAIGAIGIALVFANLDKIARFKTPAFEAELRTVVDKAYAAIEQLKDLGLALSAPIVGMLQYIPLKYKLDRVQKIAATLKELGASQAEIDLATGTIYGRVSHDHLTAILYLLRDLNKDKAPLFQGIDEGKMNSWDQSTVENFITSNGLVKNDEIDERFLDLEFFERTKTLRRPDRWQS
jgi:hypothetical protein